MTALEEITQAIGTLERLKATAFPDAWEAHTSGRAGGDHWYVVADDQSIASISANDGEDEDHRQPTAELIVTLHRTIDAQLAILRDALDIVQFRLGLGLEPGPGRDQLGLALARAINRSES